MLEHLDEAVAAAEQALQDDPRLKITMPGGWPSQARRAAAQVAVAAAAASIERHLRGQLHLVEEWRVSVPSGTPGQTGRHAWSTSFNEDAAWADHAQCVKEVRWGTPDQVWVERHFVVPDGTTWVRVHLRPDGGAQR